MDCIRRYLGCICLRMADFSQRRCTWISASSVPSSASGCRTLLAALRRDARRLREVDRRRSLGSDAAPVGPVDPPPPRRYAAAASLSAIPSASTGCSASRRTRRWPPRSSRRWRSPRPTTPTTTRLLERWHKEAAGYKIRYVPAQIPDLLRTPDVIAYEYSGRAAPSPSWQLRNAEFRLDYTRRPETDMEVCMPRQRLELLAEGKGLWRGLDRRCPAGAARLHGRPWSKSSIRAFGCSSTTSGGPTPSPTPCSGRSARRSSWAKCTWC